MASMVYFIQANGRIKIGVSGHIAGRFLTIRETSGDPTARLLAAFPGNRRTEAAIHRAFSACHSNGEWFEKSDPLMQFIASVGLDSDLEDISAQLPPDAPRVTHLISELINILKAHGDVAVFLQAGETSFIAGRVRIAPARYGEAEIAVIKRVVEPVDE